LERRYSMSLHYFQHQQKTHYFSMVWPIGLGIFSGLVIALAQIICHARAVDCSNSLGIDLWLINLKYGCYIGLLAPAVYGLRMSLNKEVFIESIMHVSKK